MITNKMNLMFITNDVDIAKHVIDSDVNRIFVDLEVLGKYDRQGHLDTVISNHSVEDVGKIRAALPKAELLVRINPLNIDTNNEIDRAIEQGADIIMLPMFHSKKDIDIVGNMINGRAAFIPLIETKSAAESIEDYANSSYITECFIGLNDLHRELGLSFMFELLSTGYVENIVNVIKKAGKPFGFGGIARIGEGALPAELILAEHVRLGSSSVILSRAFHQRAQSITELKAKIDLNSEVNKLHHEVVKLRSRDDQQIYIDKTALVEAVDSIVRGEK